MHNRKTDVYLSPTQTTTKMKLFTKGSLFTLAIATLILSSFTSCSSTTALKESTSTKNYASKLVSGPWLMNSVVSTHNTEIFDLYSEMDEREKDNSLIFKTDNTVVSDEGATKYSENDPQVFSKGNWSISEDGRVLKIEEYGMVSELEILKLTSNELKLRAVDYDSTTNTSMSLTICYYQK